MYDMYQRPRRLRNNSAIRELSAETILNREKLIMPYFVMEGENKQEEIKSMAGIYRLSVDQLVVHLERDYKLGIRKVILFGIPEKKDSMALEAYNSEGIVQLAVRRLKSLFPDLFIITDVCLCEYMDHGHCGIVKDGEILNDPTLELLAKTALSHAEAGADMVAPSDMMDGRVRVIRETLDRAGYTGLPIMSYSVKYSSSFYGPFRDAAGSAPQFGDRKTYQMDCRNSKEALKEVLLDEEEGADIIMVKPALSYLDIVKQVKEMSHLPVSVYNVSGEYAMVKATVSLGYAVEADMVREIMTSFFRAGADMVISYHTRDIYENNWF